MSEWEPARRQPVVPALKAKGVTTEFAQSRSMHIIIASVVLRVRALNAFSLHKSLLVVQTWGAGAGGVREWVGG